MLYGRDAELSIIADLLARARSGGSGALVLRGDPGIGKTALLTEAAAMADGFRTMRVTGVESESELTFAGVQLLLRSALDRIETLPQVQADALRGALGLAALPGPPDRFLIGLAVLALLAESATDRPLLCVVDDAQWLDRASAEALLFAARRLDSESIVLLFAARANSDMLFAPVANRDMLFATGANRDFPAGTLPELRLTGLSAAASADLLDAADLSEAARYRILTEAAGNPLALLELPGAIRANAGRHEIATEPLPLTDRLRQAFEGRLGALPRATGTLLLVAAVEGTGDLTVILRAAATLGSSGDDLDSARHAGLIELFGETVAFRHPLVRAAVQHAAPLSALRTAHRALAAAMDRPAAADRRAWHLGAAVDGPDEAVATALEQTAVHAQERSGAAGTWYVRAAELSVEPASMARRLTLAAEAMAEAGELSRAAELAERAVELITRTPLPGDQNAAALSARLAQVQANADFLHGDPAAAHRRMMSAADSIGATDPVMAADLLIEATHIAWYTGPAELADTVGRLKELRLEPGERPEPLVRLLIRAVAPVLGLPAGDAADTDEAIAAARAAGDDSPGDLVLIAGVALLLGRDRMSQEIAAELTGRLRKGGLIGFLPATLFYAASAQFYGGRIGAARHTVAEALDLADATAQQHWVGQFDEVRANLAAVAGDEQRCAQLIDAAWARGGDVAWRTPWAICAAGMLDLGSGRAESALHRLGELAVGRRYFHIPAIRSTPDLVEAAVRVGRPGEAAEGFALYENWAGHTGQPWTMALVHRCRALLAEDGAAEAHFRTALALVGPDERPFEQARTHLLYGEWLRRAKRKAEARTHLSVALTTFERLGAAPWAQRAAQELTATGHTAGGRGPAGTASAAAAVLTPQELQIVRLAAQGLSNKDIAAQLFLSPRTIGAHLYKAYPKLGVMSRGELTDLELN